MGLIAAVATGSSSATKQPERGFRPDIQALRAVAVMSVVLYHLWPDSLPGGFVGVDVFFVISGFLITQHLASELGRTGTISLTHFWARRIRRLLPAAFTVLGASAVIMLLLMPMLTWTENAQEIGASGIYIENWLLAHNAVDYLAAENAASLVQHYWSLSVEEQFYLVWPLLLLMAMLSARLLRRRHHLNVVRSALALVVLVSFALSVVWTHSDASAAFFVTPTRAWEFALGGLLAMGPGVTAGESRPALRAVGVWLGIAMIGYSVFFITGKQPFPGVIALVPVLGAALVLAGGTSSARWAPAPLAGLPAVQWLGNYSYSIYLWHWPLIVGAPWVIHQPLTWSVKLVILAATLVLAWATKRYIEDPVRTGVRWRVKRWPSYAFAATGMVVFVVLAAVTTGHVNDQNRVAATAATAAVEGHAACFGAAAIVTAGQCADVFERTAQVNTAFAAADLSGSEDCQQRLRTPSLLLCTFGDTVSPRKTVVLVGNSHALRLMPALDLYGQQHHWKVVLASKTYCLGLTTKAVGSQSPDDSCLSWSAQLQQRLLEMPDLDAVIFVNHQSDAPGILAGEDPSPADVDAAEQQVLETWTALKARGAAVLVTGDVPGVRPESGPACVALPSSDDDPCAMPRSSVVRPNLLDQLASEHPELTGYLPLTRYFCDASICHALIGGVVVYSDGHHLTRTYSRSLSEFLGADITRQLAG